MNDTQDTPQVANPVHVKPTKAQMRSITHGKSWATDLTIAEDMVISALRAAKKASKNRKAYREWNAWEVMRVDVRFLRRGGKMSAMDVQEDPERYAIVTLIAAYLDKIEKDAKDAKNAA